MVKLNADGTVDLNEMAVRIAKKEAGPTQVDIAQIKEIMKDNAQDLLEIEKAHGRDKMVETISRLAK